MTLLRAVWQTEHGQVYQILRGSPWPERLQPLIKRYESTSSTLIELSVVEANRLLVRFLPRQDLDLSEQVLRNNSVARCCRLPRPRSTISGARGPKYYSKLHKLRLEMGPGHEVAAPEAYHGTPRGNPTQQRHPRGDGNARVSRKLKRYGNTTKHMSIDPIPSLRLRGYISRPGCGNARAGKARSWNKPAHTRDIHNAGMHNTIFCSCFGPTVVYRRTTAQGMYRTQIKRLKMRNNNHSIFRSQCHGSGAY